MHFKLSKMEAKVDDFIEKTNTNLEIFTKGYKKMIASVFTETLKSVPSALKGQWKQAAEEAATLSSTSHPATTGPILEALQQLTMTVGSLQENMASMQKENVCLQAELHRIKTTNTYNAQTRPTTPAPYPTHPITPILCPQTPYFHSPTPTRPVSPSSKLVAFEGTSSEVELDYSDSPLVHQPPVPTRPATPLLSINKNQLNPLGLTKGADFFLRILSKFNNNVATMGSWAQVLLWGRFGPLNDRGHHMNWASSMKPERTKIWLDEAIRRAFAPGSYALMLLPPTTAVGGNKKESKVKHGWNKCLHDGFNPVVLSGPINYVHPEEFTDQFYNDLYTPSSNAAPAPVIQYSQNQPQYITTTHPQQLEAHNTRGPVWTQPQTTIPPDAEENPWTTVDRSHPPS